MHAALDTEHIHQIQIVFAEIFFSHCLPIREEEYWSDIILYTTPHVSQGICLSSSYFVPVQDGGVI